MASTTQHSPRLQDAAAAAATTITTSSPDATAVKRKRRKSRQAIIEEELWQLRLRTFVKSESLRLNTSLSPRSQLTFDESDDGGGEGGTDMKNRQWRGSNKRHNGKNNFIEKMRDAARNARVFQLRIAGRRSWWPASSGPTVSAIPLSSSTITVGARQNDNRGVLKCCNDDRGTSCKQKKKDKRELVALTNSIDKLLLETDSMNRNQIMSMTEKRHKQEGTKNATNKKNKFEWKFWKKTGKANDFDETTSIDGDTVQSSITNTANNKNNNTNSGNNNKDNILLDDDSAIMEIAEKIDTEEKKIKQKIVAAVATTSVSSLGVVLAIILL